MRCPDCNKFVPFDEPTAERESEEIGLDLNGNKLAVNVSASVRLVLPCGECGTELKETNFELEASADHECAQIPKDEGKARQVLDDSDVGEGDWDDPETGDYMQTKDRNGKSIKDPRYMKHFYTVTQAVTVKCPFCQEEISLEMQDEIQGSGMDEMV